MTYRQAFDRLGNPVYHQPKASIQHRIIRWASFITGAICVGIMLWGR